MKTLALCAAETNIEKEVLNLIELLNDADNQTKASIENKLVAFGKVAIKPLISALMSSKGSKRGVLAMTIIRIGESCIEELKSYVGVNANTTWIANYLISEIACVKEVA